MHCAGCCVLCVGRGYSVRFHGLRFVNASQRTQWTIPFNQIFLDLDGSLTGFANGVVTPFTPFNNFNGSGSGCTRADGALDHGIVCDATETVRRVSIDRGAFVGPRWRRRAVDAASVGVTRLLLQPRSDVAVFVGAVCHSLCCSCRVL